MVSWTVLGPPRDPASGAITGYRRGSDATVTLTYDTTGRLATAGGRVYAYDSLGRRHTEGPSGNPSQTTYTWSGDSLTAYSGPGGTATYTCDGDGQRVRSVVTTAGITTTTCDYSGTRLNALDATRSDGTTYSIDYLYDDDGALFAGAYRGSDATAGVPFMLVTTDKGDVRELLDASGASFAFYAYDAYGNPDTTRSASATTALVPSATVAAGIAARQPLRYASYAFDSESGLYYCSARYYDPATFAFISRDPVKADAEESLYQYCSGDPVNQSDPSGLIGDVSGTGRVTRLDTLVHNVTHTKKTSKLHKFLTKKDKHGHSVVYREYRAEEQRAKEHATIHKQFVKDQKKRARDLAAAQQAAYRSAERQMPVLVAGPMMVTGPLPEYGFHWTNSAALDSIRALGLRSPAYVTTRGGLSPAQAMRQLQLKGEPRDVEIRVNLRKMSEDGIRMPQFNPVKPSPDAAEPFEPGADEGVFVGDGQTGVSPDYLEIPEVGVDLPIMP